MAWVDIELVLELLTTEEMIPEVLNPEKANIQKGEIEFRNVNFTYDKKKPYEDQKQILEGISFT